MLAPAAMNEDATDHDEVSGPVRRWLVYSCLIVDVISMKVFLGLLGQDDGWLDAHLFFFDRYSQLAVQLRRRGRIARARQLEDLAEQHYNAAPDDDPPEPEAAAIAMPVPSTRIVTNAVSRGHMGGRNNPRETEDFTEPNLAIDECS